MKHNKFYFSTMFILLSLIALTVFSQSGAIAPSLASLIETERAFARYAIEKNVRDAFIEYFADDGVNFLPHPTNTKTAYRKTPAPTGPPQVLLKWAPVYGDVSAGGDLGYSTGPFALEDQTAQKRPTRHGLFFSIWKKQADGNWRVAVDMGVGTPAQTTPLEAPFEPAPAIKSKPAGSRETQLAEINELDRTVLFDPSKGRQFLALAHETIRVYRDGARPLIGKTVVRDWIERLQPETTAARSVVKTLEGGVAASGDLGYCYGFYEKRSAEDAVLEKGYYTRVWKRDETGSWRIVFDVNSPLPKEAK
jgi:ketosteroid isomerase-like protein